MKPRHLWNLRCQKLHGGYGSLLQLFQPCFTKRIRLELQINRRERETQRKGQAVLTDDNLWRELRGIYSIGVGGFYEMKLQKLKGIAILKMPKIK